MVAHSLIRSVLLLATTAFASSVVQLQPGLRLRGGRSGGPLGRLPGVNLLAEQKEVLVTGGVGYIGSHTVLLLLEAGRRVLVLERDVRPQDRIVGELLQPGGYQKLQALGLGGCVEGIDA